MVTLKQHSVFWICIMALTFLGWPALISTADIMRQVRSEVDMMAAAFGHDEAKQIVDKGNEIFHNVFHRSGLAAGVDNVYAQQKGEESQVLLSQVNALSSATNTYWTTFRANIYRLSLRVLVLLTWFPYIVPFLIAMAVDGFVIRKIKLSSYGYMSPMRYSVGLHIILIGLFFPALYLIAPIPVSPYFPPYWALFLAFPTVMMLSNIQRMASD
jgi:hypothetical protein